MAVKKGLWTDNNTGDILYPQTSGDMIEQDSNHRLVTDVEKNTWNGKANASHSHNYAGSNSAGGAATTALACTGNSATATKATQDSSGQQINSTYIKSLSVSGRTITYTKGNGATGTITTQDTNTTYNVATSSANGLMSSADKAKLDGVATGANKYTHPSTHPATVITEDSSHRFVTDEEKNNWNNLQRDNLLINADFRYGVINQKGENSYTSTNYNKKCGVCAWVLNGRNATQTVASKYLELKETTEQAWFYQKINYALLNTSYTFAVYVKSISGNAKIKIENYPNKIAEKTLVKGLNTLTFNSGNFDNFTAFIELNIATVQIEYIKLEQGAEYSGMPVWDEANELDRCLEVYQVFTKDELRLISYYNAIGGPTPSYALNFKRLMRKIPTIVGTWDVRDGTTVQILGSNISLSELGKTKYSAILEYIGSPTIEHMTYAYPNSAIILDALDY